MAKLLQIVARTLGCLVIAGLTLELCARTEDRIAYGAPFFGNYSMDSLYTFDELGKYGKPNASFQKWHLNDLGYRGPALRAGTYRIACIGSSETFGLYESPENEWPRQLERMLNQQRGGENYEVVDVAFAGMSMGTSLKRLPQLLHDVKPQMVVIYPSYTPYIDRPDPQPWPLPAAPAKGSVPLPAEHFQWRLSGRLETFFKSALPESVQTAMRSYQMRRSAKSVEIMDALPQKNIDAFATDLRHEVETLKANGVTVVLVTHANRFGTTVTPSEEPVMIAWRKFYPMLTGQGLLDTELRMSDVVRQVGAQDGVPVVDAAKLIPPGGQNFAEFVHFTDAGSKALASLVAAQIERDGTAQFPQAR